jgi:hypothetical protein
VLTWQVVSRKPSGPLLALLAVSCFADAPQIDVGETTGTDTTDTVDTIDTTDTTATSGTTGSTPGSSTDASDSTTEADTITGTESSTGHSDCDDCPTGFCDDLRGCARIVFVSQTELSGAMGGVTMADALCNQEAERADLHGEFAAWLPDGLVAARLRTQVQGSLLAFARPDGVRVANDGTAFLPGAELLAPIEVLATGVPASSVDQSPCDTDTEGYGVWTGPAVPGDESQMCDGWTNGGADVVGEGVGRFDSATRWSSACAQDTCDHLARIYCVQLPAP